MTGMEFPPQKHKPSLFLEVEPRVWIVGDSIIHRLHTHICDQRLDPDPGLHCEVTWASDSTLWEHLLPALHFLRTTAPEPYIIVVHLGGDSLCREGRDRLGFLREMKRDLSECFRLFPGARVVFSEILPRLRWEGQRARTGYGVERSRRWINGKVSGFLAATQMRCVCHRNISLLHLCRDGVHLSPEGNQRLLINLREALQEELRG